MPIQTILYNIILSPITQIIESSYKLFFHLFKNTGLSIIGVSLTVTVLCLPLYIVAEGWQDTERDIQQKMKGGISRIKKAFKGDEQYMMLSTYYKQHKYHPIMTLRSSFGILIQIPFFLAAYHTLASLPDLQGKSFLFISDMGKPDAIFSLGTFSVNVLPILMTTINCVSGAIYSKGHGIREKIQIYGMAIIFLVLLYDSPAGLVVYWTMNNILSLVKNIFYKMKNPLKVLYYCFCAFILAIIAYIWFIYSKGAGVEKKTAATIALLAMLPIALYIKVYLVILKKSLVQLMESKKLRLGVFLTSATALVILTGLALPSSLISSSTQEFSNIDSYTIPTVFLHSSFWMSAGVMLFWPTCIFFLFKEKIQTLISFLFAILLFSGIANAFIFSGNFGTMDATLKFIDGLTTPSPLFTIANTVASVMVIITITTLFHFRKAQVIRIFSAMTICVFTVLSAINIAHIKRDYAEYAKIIESNCSSSIESFKAKYHLSKTEKNVVIFMFDRMENSYVPYTLQDNPILRKKLDGFTFYPNTISFNGHTLMGSPGVYGGYEYTPYEMNRRDTVPLKQKHNEALSVLPTIFGEAGFESTISDLSWANYSWIADMSFAKDLPNTNAISLLGKYSGDFKKEHLKSKDSLASLGHILNRNLFWVSLFRESTTLIRPLIYYKGTWWENGTKETSASFIDWFAAMYYMDRITAVDSEKPTLSIITNEATHSSEKIDMYDIDFGKSNSLPNEDSYPANMAVMNSIAAFIDFLKENGVYDNTRIIITSDHGIGVGSIARQDFKTPDIDGYSKDHFHCILLIKDFNSHGDIKTDNSFMTNADVPSIALSDIIENARNPFTGATISIEEAEKQKRDGVVITKENLFQPGHSSSKFIFTVPDDSWYIVKDNIFEDANWQRMKQ